MRRNLILWLVCCALLALNSRHAGAQSITALTPLPNGNATFAYGISADGTAATGYSREPVFIGTFDTPTRWSIPLAGTSVPASLGFLLGQGSSFGVGMSDDGNVITGYSGGALGRGFRWAQSPNPSPGLFDLGLLPGGSYLVGRQISGNGLVIVGWGDTTSNTPPSVAGPQHAYRWTGQGGGTFTPLGTFGGNSSYAIGVNYDGSVTCGHATNGSGVTTAFRWQGGVMQNLGLLPNGTFSFGYAISSDGSTVVGQANVGLGTQNTRAFRWRNNVLQDIGAIGPNANGTAAYAVNGDGEAVVGESGYFRAMLWTEALGMVELMPHLASLGVNLNNWVLNDCRGISPDGTCLVGNGGYNLQQRAWVVQVPYLQLPMVVQHPIPQTLCGPGNVTFDARITAVGGGTLLKYWRLNGVGLSDGPTGSGSTISGAFTETLTISNASPADNGLYDFVAFNFYDSAVTNAAQLTVSVAPAGALGPFNANTCVGGTATYSTVVIPLNGGPYLYQWRRNLVPLLNGPTGSGSVISGANAATLNIANTSPADAANYDCIITTPGCGTIFSATAGLATFPGGSGDGNLSGQADAADIQGFVNILINGGAPSPGYCAYDMNGDGVVDLNDWPAFLASLLN